MPEGIVDLAISFSVFSHLCEESALFWLSNLSRVVKPNGFLVFTSWGKSLLRVFDKLDSNPEDYEYDWERNISAAFPDKQKVRNDYSEGRLVFGRHGSAGGLNPDNYGIAMMPLAWVEANTNMKIVEFIDDSRIVPQATFILQKQSC